MSSSYFHSWTPTFPNNIHFFSICTRKFKFCKILWNPQDREIPSARLGLHFRFLYHYAQKYENCCFCPYRGKNGQKSFLCKIIWNPLDHEVQRVHLGRDFENFQPFPLKPPRNGDITRFKFLQLYEATIVRNDFFLILWNPLDYEIKSVHLGRHFETFQPFTLKPFRKADIVIFNFVHLYEQWHFNRFTYIFPFKSSLIHTVSTTHVML